MVWVRILVAVYFVFATDLFVASVWVLPSRLICWLLAVGVELRLVVCLIVVYCCGCDCIWVLVAFRRCFADCCVCGWF